MLSRASITGGHLLQGSAFASVTASDSRRRLPWSHYLSRRGVVETIGKVDLADLMTGFSRTDQAAEVLDLGAIGAAAMASAQRSIQLDRDPPFRTVRTRFRWIAATAPATDGRPQVRLTLEPESLRTFTLTNAHPDPSVLAELCEDIARHDWLLTTLLTRMEIGLSWPGSLPEKVAKLQPAIDYLLHLWMPAARVDKAVIPVWNSLEERPGFSRQWENSVNRIRDQVTVSVVSLLGAAAGERVRE